MTTKSSTPIRVGIVVPHIFMQDTLLPHVIFSPADLAIRLADGLAQMGVAVTLYSPGTVKTRATNVTADLSLFKAELAGRGYDYLELLKKHPATFIALARQVQAELVAKAFSDANADELDIVHIYTNEEDIAVSFAELCSKPVVFTHHDPFNFLVRYKNTFPKYKHLNWIALSEAQKKSMPKDTNWVATIRHGLPRDAFSFVPQPEEDYIAYIGRIIEPKGVHLAIDAVERYNQQHKSKIRLKIAGKHYSGHTKDTYWQKQVEPRLNANVEYVGYISSTAGKQDFLGNATALIIPSTFEEPFGMVMLEAMACGTPIIGLKSGAIPEVVNSKVGVLVEKSEHQQTIASLADAFDQVRQIKRSACRQEFERRFEMARMCEEHFNLYKKLTE